MEGKVLIFVVEDEHLLHPVLEETLEDAGYAVAIAASAEEAMKMLDVSGSEFRALLTDVNLGSDALTGWDVARHAREIKRPNPSRLYDWRKRARLGLHGSS